MIESPESSLLRDLIEEVRKSGEARSSVEISTSTRGTDVRVKVYADSPVDDAANRARDTYARMMRDIQVMQTNGWAETLERLS